MRQKLRATELTLATIKGEVELAVWLAGKFHVHFDGWVPTRIQNFAGLNASDLSHRKINPSLRPHHR